ncbi:MAG: hypothetical protein KDD60_07420 [Bdellovibrionales bacterium]|nr:hypothetical protein [Bdellovibrionales bacterium]
MFNQEPKLTKKQIAELKKICGIKSDEEAERIAYQLLDYINVIVDLCIDQEEERRLQNGEEPLMFQKDSEQTVTALNQQNPSSVDDALYRQ